MSYDDDYSPGFHIIVLILIIVGTIYLEIKIWSTLGKQAGVIAIGGTLYILFKYGDKLMKIYDDFTLWLENLMDKVSSVLIVVFIIVLSFVFLKWFFS